MTSDPRLKIITDALCGLIPGSKPADLTVRVQEQLLAGQNTWDGSLAAAATRIYTALASRDAEQPEPSPLAQAEHAKRQSDLGGEIGALMDGQRGLESAAWYPAQAGDIVHIHYESGILPAWGETYVVQPDPQFPEDLELRLLHHTAADAIDEDSMAGCFAPGVTGAPLMEPWFEAGPHRLTIVRNGRVIHPAGDAR